MKIGATQNGDICTLVTPLVLRLNNSNNNSALDVLDIYIHSYSFIKVSQTHCDNLNYIAKVENSVNTSL